MDVHVARQPILDHDLRLFGYELLFRESDTSNSAAPLDPSLMASRVILSALGDIGLESLVGTHRAFVNTSRELLLSTAHEVLPPRSVVVELLETAPPDAEVLEAVTRLKERGYLIALDDFVYRPGFAPLLDLVDVVKLDVLDADLDRVADTVQTLSQFDVALLAERVETHDVFTRCRDLGFTYFQGYFFARPQLVTARQVPQNKATALELLRLLNDPATTAVELEEVIGRDVSLSYKLLRHLNSSAMALRRRVTSIREALVMLGEHNLRKWASLVVFSTVSEDKPSELLRSAHVRARMCEALARAADHEAVGSATAFTAGLFSLLDAMLDQPMEQALEPLGLTAELHAALVHHLGLLGELLRLTLAWERGDWDTVAHARLMIQLDDQVLRRSAFEAFQWVESLSTP